MSHSQQKHTTEKVVVIGTSAGGMKALTVLIRQIHDDFPAPILVVQHLAADASGDALLEVLNKQGIIKCHHAVNGSTLENGHLYLAPSDHHLMIDEEHRILTTKGAQENRSRPAIDPLFRSAAVVFSNNVIGILLTGYLDDGTAGMSAIKRCGGICIIQDRQEADYPDMPNNALNHVDVDYCLPLSEMGSLLYDLLAEMPHKKLPIPKDISIGTLIKRRACR